MSEKEVNLNEGLVPARRGRPTGSRNRRTVFAHEWSEKLGLDPVQFLVTALSTDTVEVTKANPDGTAVLDADQRPVKHFIVIPFDVRIQCARELLPYMYPRLQATQVSTQVEVSAEVILPTAQILADPKLSGPLSELAMMIAQLPDATAEPCAEFPDNMQRARYERMLE